MDVRKVLAILCSCGSVRGRLSAVFRQDDAGSHAESPAEGGLSNRRSDKDNFAARGELGYRDPRTGSDVVISGVELSVRGHTSRRGSECPFPKLKLAFGKKETARDESIFAGMEGLRIGTHCGENEGEQLTSKFGRLANEKSPLREAFVYRLLEAMGVPTLRARPARIAYVDTTRRRVSRRSFATRFCSKTMTTSSAGSARPAKSRMEQFTTARELFAPADTARLAFAQAMIGNFDWCLRFYPDDTYRCDAKQPLWNISAFKRR